MSTAQKTLVRPAAWTMAQVNTTRLENLNRRIATSEAHSNVLAAKVIALTTADADADEFARQLWDTLDALQCLRLDQWALLHALK